jgi:hypothetical protein
MSKGNVNNDAGVPANNLGEETDVSGRLKLIGYLLELRLSLLL